MEKKQISRRAQKTREQIRTAAQELFLRHGFSGASTDAIMTQAGIASKETLYRYYTNKEELFIDVLRHLTVEHPRHQLFQEGVPTPTSREELRAALLWIANELLGIMTQPDYQALLRVLFGDVVRFPHLGNLFWSTVPERGMAAINELLMKAEAQQVIKDVDREAIVRMLLGSLLTYMLYNVVLRIDGEQVIPSPTRIEAIIDTLMKAMAA
ncbi:MAG TPA: TetR/AcrR family transcriptional regulator [Ktedonobacteraceae bacterium]|nr:TetR/AcrR family transcriptional regulator [Ktedonobacteraceae bacterium]